MPREASAWGWYASMNDDVRHHLIERGWFGQHQRDPAFEQDVAAMQAEADALYGPPEAGLDPDFDEQPGAGEDFYGAPRESEPDVNDLYGQASPGFDGPEQMEPEP